ncbi:uncharacterized protein LOC108627461 isoform X2 [Ceratina calcarata]|uniref:Uncharacterized protein LOC108627461 isoform X1 n=1 Tax=Ceratina calcarata TaxID=156304 RepID=A0AAJ7S611_9HYME|nr:uncharacterized protein LOC108627461 isoform X1 [Ceratina calcarata]XP_026671390.1 uncharacterized protein LOC108627461 isoform X2 [Ceratina calcarata]
MIWKLDRSGSWFALFVAILIAIEVVQGNIKDSTVCGRSKCKVPASRKFKYQESVSYHYRYSVAVSTNLGKDEHANDRAHASSGSPGNESTLHLNADLVIRFDSPCEGSLKFGNVSLSHDPHTYNPEFPDRAGAEFKKNLERFALRFAFDDGRIDELCPDKRDHVWALNLKRGVLSMMQNTMQRFDIDRRANELDVNGICETSYRLHEAKRTSLVLNKTKNLSDCVQGSKHFSVIRSNAYRSPRRSGASRHPLLNSQIDCELTIDRNVYEKIVCKELHRVRPLSNGHTGARTESSATLQLIGESKDDYYSIAGDDDENEDMTIAHRGKRTNLLYDYSKTPRTVHGELRSSRDLLKTMCKLGVTGVDEMQQRFSEIFTAFVHSARLLDYPSLSQLFVRANGICKTGKKYIVDALPFIGSNAAVNLMKDLIIKRYVDQATIDKWMVAFALIPRPNLDTIRILSPLLEFQDKIPEAQFILSYSATIYAFCSGHETRCANVEEVTRFIRYLEDKVDKGCMPRTHSVSSIKKTMEVLKAIGNMGLETERLSKLLNECTDDIGGFLPMEIRVASIEAHRRMPSCEQTRDLHFLNRYRNFSLDSEIRIASYLQVMRCPDYNVVKTIKHTLRSEEINQVGTFVWSHLTNLYNSASPTRIEIQSLLTDRDIDDKFNSDRRKFSRNYDGSFFSEEYNFGANYQGNLIFSPKSYIPRSATFNLTFDLFGESVNVFEMTTRLEGLEYYAEKFFGPDGPYGNEKVSSFFKHLLRSFRSADPEEEQDYWKRVKRLPNVIDNNFQDPKISFSYKIFGNDLKYSMLNGDHEIRGALLRINPWEKLKQITSGNEIHYENAVMFLDSTYVVPMTSGMPVRLDFAGSAACNFKMSGLLDAKGISKGEIELVSNIAPSASVDIIASMTVDAFYKTAGTKLRSNMYSSGAVEIHLDVKGTRSIRLSLGLPNKKMEVFSIGTDVLLTKGNGAEIEEKPLDVLIAGRSIAIPRNVIANTSCTWTALDRLIGLKMCVDYQLSNRTKDPKAPYFVLSGPSLFKISMIKSDPTAQNYLFEYKWEKKKEENLFRVAFDTPGSQVNRELSATVSFDAKTHNVTVLLRSAGNSLVAEGTYKSTENETFVDLGFDVNGTKHLDASLGYTIKRFGHGFAFSPQMHLIVNNERIAALSGTIKTAWKNNISQCDIDLTFRTKKVWSKLVGYIIRRNVSLAGDFQLEYQLQKMPKKETLRFEMSTSNRSSKTLTHKTLDLKLRSTAYPQLNTVITAWYQQALGHLELHAEVNSSPHLMDDRHKLTARLIISYSKMYFQNQDTKVSALFAVTKPIQNLDLKIGMNHYSMGPESRTGLLIGYAPGKEITLTVNLIMPRGLTLGLEGHANLTIPNFHPMLFDARITERSKRTYDLDLAGTWFSGHNMTARGIYTDKSVASVVSHSLKLILKSPSFVDILLSCKLYRDYRDIRASVHVEQLDRDTYAFVLNHSVTSPTTFISYVEGRYKNSVYSLTTNVDTKREIRAEIHVDKWRDIHLALTGVNEENNKEFGAELKWDANRDPALKIAISFGFEKTVLIPVSSDPERNVSAVFRLTYPGRYVTAACRATARGYYNYSVDATVDWNPEQTMRLLIATQNNLQPWIKSSSLETRLITPFDNWKETALTAKYLQEQNRIKASGSVHWRDSQHLIAELEGSKEERQADKFKEWRVNCGIHSSMSSISSTTVTITHKMVDSRNADTRLLVLSNENAEKVIDAWSIWYLNKGYGNETDETFNLTGNLHLESSVIRYKKTDMKCQLRVLSDWKFVGATNLELDKKTYSGELVGDFHRIKESSMELNLTTPLEKFSFIRGRFGLSESNRHIVAKLDTPSGSLGIEAICQLFTSNYQFHVLLSVATPLEILQETLLIAKLNDREADFRVGYIQMLVGFQGVWHYHNITDFHYRYLLFTPIDSLKEAGVVAKLITSRRTEDDRLSIDTEFSIRLSDDKSDGKIGVISGFDETKIGIRVKAGPKNPPIVISIEPPSFPSSVNHSESSGDQGSEADFEDFENYEDAPIHWHGEAEAYLAIIAPIAGELDVDKQGTTSKVAANVRYLQGTISLDDILYIEDLFNMKNELTITFPFQSVNEITCLNAFVVDMETSNYTMQAVVNVGRNGTLYETGVLINYVSTESELDDSHVTHSLRVNMKTPLEFIKFLDTNTSLEMDETFRKTRIEIRAPNSTITVHGSLEAEDAFVDASLDFALDTPFVKLPKTVMKLKRDLSEKDKYLMISGEIQEPISKSISFQSGWRASEARDHVTGFAVFQSWMESLKGVEVRLSYLNAIPSNSTATLLVYAKHLFRTDYREYKFSGNYTDNLIDAELYTSESMNDPHFTFHGNTRKLETDDVSLNTKYELNGQLRNRLTAETRPVLGEFELTRNGTLQALQITARTPGTLELPETPESAISNKSGDDDVVLTLKREKYGLNVDLLSRYTNGTIEANFVNSFNWDVRVRADINETNQLRFTTFMNVQVNGNTTLYVHAETPIPEIQNVSLTGNLLLTNNSGDARASGRFNEENDLLRFVTIQWKLVHLIDIFGRVMTGYREATADGQRKIVDCQLFFRNPRRAFRNVDAGFDLNVDQNEVETPWKFAANTTIGFRNHENIDGVFAITLPPPNKDDHRFLISYHSNANGPAKDASYVIGYNAIRANTNYASDGSIHMSSRDINGHVRASWGMLPVQSINNLLNVSFDGKEIELKYSLYTPKFQQQETLVFLFDYNRIAPDSEVRAINSEIYYPASTNIATAKVLYDSLVNVNGTVNAVVPVANISQLGCQFIVLTTLQRNKRYAKVFWPQDTAIFDSDYSYSSEKLNSDLEGVLHVEVPVSTRHVSHLTYGYKKRPQTTTGYSELIYNGQKAIYGLYNSKSESRAGFERDRTQITIENTYKPIGILYVNQYEYSAGNEGTNFPTVEYKYANLYQLDNRTAFDVVAESTIKTSHTGQNIHLKAIHSNRTVQFKTDYQVLPGEFDQTSWLSLAEDVWISYRVNILNKTTERVDNQFLVLNVSYPGRNFSLDGSYWISSDELRSEVKLDWDRETERPRTIGARFNWANLSSSAVSESSSERTGSDGEEDETGVQQRAVFTLRHPRFSKQIYLKGELLKTDPRDLINVRLVADYSTDPDKLFMVSGLFRDESELPMTRKYFYGVSGKHLSSKFHLDVQGFVRKYEYTLFETYNTGNYKRSFLDEDTGKLNAKLDLVRNEVLFQREHNKAVKYLNGRYYSLDHCYVVNGTIINTPSLNATGAFLLDLNNKLTRMMLNYTPDAVESLRMYGRIPDARNAVFDIWRTYEEDFTVSDVSFYLKLNHSRLITSTLRWRPELKADIITFVRDTAMDMYNNINNDADYWKQYIKDETVNVISDVWDNAREDEELKEFLDDCENLKELQTDFDELKTFLNDSYNANDFYIKNIVSFGMYAIDELSLRSHIESLPNILNEIWAIMGESGEAIRNSLLWVIEAIKSAFNKIPEIVAAIIRGDTISQLVNVVDKLLEKYDKFVKDLHVSFIKYIESLWGRISQSISQQWNRFLLFIEPLFIRFIHYLETVIWKASKEILDFLYDRRNDLIASPYFDRLANFTQDVDKFYRDIKANDIITNVKKYTEPVIRLLKEKYFVFVPFGKELKDVVDEIITELSELKKLPSIHYALEKMWQVYDRAYYIYDYLEIQARLESALRLIHSKLLDVSQTALQAESKYREAKTKFIFDPNQGLMCLEQKLPMSWHTFNQTPEFQEIPEFRAISDITSYFVSSSDITFWSIYRYKPYMDPVNWLPPFRAQATIMGSKHFITFDGRHIDFRRLVNTSSCSTYLLARDFVGNTFTILLDYEHSTGGHKIIVLLEKDALELDVFNNSIKLVSKQSYKESSQSNFVLPTELENGTTYVYQMDSIVIVERNQNQFRLECNFKFDLCTLELSGWYHGKTAGILGTMNYEPMDDTTGSDGVVSKDVRTFTESWSLDRCSTNRSDLISTTTTTATPILEPAEESSSTLVSEFCNDLFVNKSSEFVSCFDTIDPSEYWKMCDETESRFEACTVALAFMQACTFHETYLRIPDVCSNCSMINGSRVAEGQFAKLEDHQVPASTDVVFIVEGKECNRNMKENRSIEHLVSQLSKELRDQGLADNRWSLVVFGADRVFDQPRTIVFDGQVFTKSVARFIDYFDYVPIGDGNRDIFAAIAFASKLEFRAGVSKTFILMPCSNCEPENQTLDYSVLNEVLLEHGVTLHILMDGDFEFEKERLNKIFYGLDATKSYTKKDARTLTGDVDLRRQVKLSKNALGYCTPLALEVNGTIFSGDKLRFDKATSIKKFASVFSKRVALTAQPNPCQNCECTADNNGVTRMECIPCVYPSPVSVDYEAFNLNDSLAYLQPLNIDYSQIDVDDS